MLESLMSQSSSILEIDLSALADNFRLLDAKTQENCTVAGVVKANAYGVGMPQVLKTLQNLNCQQFFVATLDEALLFRELNKTSSLAVLGGLFVGEESAYFEHNITPVLNTPDDIMRWNQLALKKNSKLSAMLNFDTGMNRLGLSAAEASTLINAPETIKAIDTQCVMSHFACADEKNHLMTKAQAHNFANLAQHFPNAKKSLANSSGLFRSDRYHYDIVRPGYALYGGNPTPETSNPMKSVVSLKSQILQIRDCKKGESIGYGANHVFKKHTRTATISLGYADGFLRSASGQAQSGTSVYYEGSPCKVIGRISMDLVTIDLSSIKGKQPEQGDFVEIFGPYQSIDDLAHNMGTIGYEVLTALGERCKRLYKD